ncbi:hypothetical protein GCM10009422_11050 [Brevundimonas kwangchunensis]|uniref:TonB C-terminal domain-containing protein n=1 Tax=Brevundimonas kwangchunensis TaxID=322163 RepID=A0ABN1GRT7_9CAUL
MIIGVTLAAIAVGSLIWQAGSRIEFRLPEFGFPRPKVETVEVITAEPLPADADAASADGSSPPVHFAVVQPRWDRPPVPDYPEDALSVSKGVVRLICTVQPDRSLTNCLVVEEAPSGLGFGRSALAAAGDARVAGEVPSGARVDFRVRYVLPD